MDKIEAARELFRKLEGNEFCAVESARRAFWIQDMLAGQRN